MRSVDARSKTDARDSSYLAVVGAALARGGRMEVHPCRVSAAATSAREPRRRGAEATIRRIGAARLNAYPLAGSNSLANISAGVNVQRIADAVDCRLWATSAKQPSGTTQLAYASTVAGFRFEQMFSVRFYPSQTHLITRSRRRREPECASKRALATRHGRPNQVHRAVATG